MQDFKTYTEARLTYDQFMADRPSSKFKFMWSVEGMRGRNLFRRNYYSNFPKNKARSAFDDVKYAKLLKTPLTTYKQPCRDIGTAAVETMMSRLKNPNLCARKVLLHGQLIKRASTN